jgi:(p)ppGpp synthase/HD superfamily hydrolase
MDIEKIKNDAFKAHADVNHLYDGDKPYSFHLNMVAINGIFFKKLISDKDWLNVLAAIYHHDTLEDTNMTYDEIVSTTNKDVGKIVVALTNIFGRGNDKYYEGLKKTRNSIFVKLVDRISNVQYSLVQFKKTGNDKKLRMYKKENEHFKQILYTFEYESMWNYLEYLFSMYLKI